MAFRVRLAPDGLIRRSSELESQLLLRYKNKVAMAAMDRRLAFRASHWAILFVGLLLCAPVGVAQTNPSNPAATQGHTGSSDEKGQKEQKSSGPPTTRLQIRVTDKNDKPVANASVYVRFYTGASLLHHDKLAELDLKTNLDGTLKVPPVPQGKIMIQVIATGWHTFGQWYDVQKDEETISIKLAPPPHWY